MREYRFTTRVGRSFSIQAGGWLMDCQHSAWIEAACLLEVLIDTLPDATQGALWSELRSFQERAESYPTEAEIIIRAVLDRVTFGLHISEPANLLLIASGQR